jgi:hypothetical protein
VLVTFELGTISRNEALLMFHSVLHTYLSQHISEPPWLLLPQVFDRRWKLFHAP